MTRQTSFNAHSVHLIGSWDNFTKRYPMEKDIRRAKDQWRGCYAFENIICDGDEGNSPKRTGGLKMGSTYYYFYELDDGTEIHDTSLPSTTSCPYMPGQPVNLLTVPVEIQPLRFRSASMSSMANGDLKTMNPADKFMAPRQPPPTPGLQRLNSSPVVLQMKRSARSVSPPKYEKSQWSPRTFFGIRAPTSSASESRRGRSSSLRRLAEGDMNGSTASLRSRREERRIARSVSHTRDVSPQSFKRSPSRETSPMRQLGVQESTNYMSILEIPDEIAEEAEDDDNFANRLHRISSSEKVITALSPPPSRVCSPPVRAETLTDKPLPRLPEESFMPAPLRLNVAPKLELRSHFSTSTMSSTLSSPTHSHFGFSSTPSISGSLDDEDLSADVSSGDEIMYSPVLSNTENGHGFSGYSLPDGDYASELTVRKLTPLDSLPVKSATRATFGVPPMTNMSALEQLMSEMGYLGHVIVGK